MNKFKLLFLAIVVIFIIAFTGCNKFSSPYITSIYVNNETNNEYLIYADSYSDTIIVSVKGNEKDFLIKEFPGLFETYGLDLNEQYK